MNSLSAFHSRFLRCAQFLFRDWQLLNPGLKEGKEEREGEGGRETRGSETPSLLHLSYAKDFAASCLYLYLYC